jgi:hypothetical protein
LSNLSSGWGKKEVSAPLSVNEFSPSRNTSYRNQKMGLIKKWDYVRHKNHNTHLQKTPKMAEPRPYDPLLHGFIWPLLGQKSSHKKCYRTEILATSARVIWPRAVALPDGFPIPWLPSCTADDFLHHEQTAGK